MTTDLDCLLLHVPKAHNHYLPFGDFMNITYMPMGLVAIADVMRREGLQAEIVHLGVEHVRDPGYRVVADFEGAALKSIGVTLYWHYQSYDSIEVARAMAHSHPEAFVFMGGVTAGYFAREIVSTYPEIRAVVRGHGELPALELVRTIQAGGDLGKVPNLVWRDADGVVHENEQSYTGGRTELDALNFGELSVLRNADVYASTFGFPLAYSLEYSAEENRKRLNMGRPFFPLFTGRGCPWKCTFCGGNRDTLRKLTGVSGLQWRSPERVISDIRRAMEFGYKTMSLCFDPIPEHDDYYVTLFEMIHRAKLDVDFYFECWGLPTRRFAETFRRAFPSRESYVAISPDSGHERVRKQNKQPYFSDAELYASIDMLAEFAISADIFYTIALPGETIVEARVTRDQMTKLHNGYKNLRRIMVWSVQLEPGSPQFEQPEKYGMITDRRTFADFHKAHGGDHADTYSALGFKIANFFGDERDQGGIPEFERHMQHLKCMEFCFLAPDPRDFALPEKGRAHCFERRTQLAVRRGHGQPTKPIGAQFDYVDAVAEERQLRGPQQRHGWL